MAQSRDDVFRRFDVRGPARPLYTVWELTLACDQPCTHCGSRAGEARPDELTTEAALKVVDQLAELGTFEVALIGGEAYLHPGFLEIVRALKARGIRPSMTSGGQGITAELARQMKDAGLYTVSISIDGLEPTHDLMRARNGSFAAATGALRHLAAAGVTIASNVNLNRLNQADLEPLYDEVLKPLGVAAWQVQITTPLGRAADRPAMLLQPFDLVELVPRIAKLKKRAWEESRLLMMPGNNLGYFGPEEAVIRSPPGGADHFQGCLAGRMTLGIESDGAVKGCPSLQSAHYVGGNLKQQPLKEIWETSPRLAFARKRTAEDLWGFCRTCPFAATCLGGCSFTAHAVLGRPGNNPYCHYRARTLAEQGKRERLVLAEAAPGQPFDNGRFEIVVEALDAPDVRPPTPRELVRRRGPEGAASR